MNVIGIKRILGCLDAENVKELTLDSEITKEFVEYLAQLGKLIYQAELEKPFFKVIVRAKYTIKGSLANNTIRIYLPNQNSEEYLKEFVDYINKFN